MATPFDVIRAKKLIRRVVKESDGVSVRLGRTNGRVVLHLIRSQNDDLTRTADSVTIPADPVVWSLHDWNTSNKKKDREDHVLDGLAEAVANRDAI